MMRDVPLYLDYHSTTPLDSRVLEIMLPFLTEHFGNASSVDHAHGHFARAAVDAARASIARHIGARETEIIFTSGATEANNLAIQGVAHAYARSANRPRGHLISVVTEHRAVLDPLATLHAAGFEVTLLPVDRYGQVDPHDLHRAIRRDTILISLMLANNEIGTLQPLADIGRIAKEHAILFHSDATQAVGHLPVDVEDLGLDLMSFSAHKFYGPKGIGALYVRSRAPRVKFEPLLRGGGHEHGLRSGTLNVPGIVGLSAALDMAIAEQKAEARRLRGLTEALFHSIDDELGGLRRHGHPTERLPHNLNFAIPGVQAKTLVVNLPDLAFSTGSACTSAKSQPSHVLAALGLTEIQTREAVRLGLGRPTTAEDVSYAARRFADAAKRMRRLVAP